MNPQGDPRDPLRSILLHQKQKCEHAAEFYRELANSTSEEDRWKYSREAPFYNKLQNLIPLDYAYPLSTLETAISTFDEYLQALDRFTDDQLAAFFLGVGLCWLSFPYWGLQASEDYLAKIQKGLAYYGELWTQIPPDDRWKYQKVGIFEALPSVNAGDTHEPVEALKIAYDLAESMMSILADRPF